MGRSVPFASMVFEAVNSLDLNKLILNCAYGTDFCLQKLSLYSKVEQEIEYMKEQRSGIFILNLT